MMPKRQTDSKRDFSVCFTPRHSNPTRLLEMVNGGLNLDAQNDTDTD